MQVCCECVVHMVGVISETIPSLISSHGVTTGYWGNDLMKGFSELQKQENQENE